MSVLQNIQNALSGVGFAVGLGKYPDASEPCGKVVFTDQDKPAGFLGGGQAVTETFRVIVRGSDYRALEVKTDLVKSALKAAGFIQTGGYEDVEPKEDEPCMQLAVSFKFIK